MMPALTLKDDLVVFARGGYDPLVLRPKDHSYELIGHAYGLGLDTKCDFTGESADLT